LLPLLRATPLFAKCGSPAKSDTRIFATRTRSLFQAFALLMQSLSTGGTATARWHR